VLTSTTNYNGGRPSARAHCNSATARPANAQGPGTVTDTACWFFAIRRHRHSPAPSLRGRAGKTGAGVLTLPNANTYTGGIRVISNGTLQVITTPRWAPRPSEPPPGTITDNGVMNLNIGRQLVLLSDQRQWHHQCDRDHQPESRFDGDNSGFTRHPSRCPPAETQFQGGHSRATPSGTAATIIVFKRRNPVCGKRQPDIRLGGQRNRLPPPSMFPAMVKQRGLCALRVDDAAITRGNVILQGKHGLRRRQLAHMASAASAG